MTIAIIYKNNTEIILNGVTDIQGGEKYICFQFSNAQIHKGNVVVELDKINGVRIDGKTTMVES